VTLKPVEVKDYCAIIMSVWRVFMKKTIYDIAKELKVAPSTVSKALNNSTGISEKTRKKIQAYADQVRYYPNANASKLKTKKTYSIGVIYSDVSNVGLEHSFFSSILQSFKSFVECEGYEITFVITNLANRKISYLDYCLQKGIEGVYIVSSVPNDPHLDELLQSNIPCVTTDIYYNNLLTVISDNKQGAYEAVRYFHDLGHRNIGHITETHDLAAAKERYEGFIETMEKLDCPVNNDYLFTASSYSYEAGYAVGEQFLTLSEYPSAMFVVSDIVAMGFIKALKDGGLKVPDDVSVIGFDDIPFAKHFEPSLTTINQDTKVLGERAAYKLLQMMNNESENIRDVEKIPVSLKIRDSVRSAKQ